MGLAFISLIHFSGKIKYFTCPPEAFSPATHLSAAIVTEMAKEFSLDDVDFQTKETADIEELPYIKPSATVSVETLGFFEGDDVPADARMECDTDAPAAKSVKTAKSTKAADVKIAKLAGPKLSKKDQLKMSEVLAAKGKNNPELMLAGNQRSNRMKRLAMKKAKKESARRGSPT